MMMTPAEAEGGHDDALFISLQSEKWWQTVDVDVDVAVEVVFEKGERTGCSVWAWHDWAKQNAR